MTEFRTEYLVRLPSTTKTDIINLSDKIFEVLIDRTSEFFYDPVIETDAFYSTLKFCAYVKAPSLEMATRVFFANLTGTPHRFMSGTTEYEELAFIISIYNYGTVDND